MHAFRGRISTAQGLVVLVVLVDVDDVDVEVVVEPPLGGVARASGARASARAMPLVGGDGTTTTTGGDASSGTPVVVVVVAGDRRSGGFESSPPADKRRTMVRAMASTAITGGTQVFRSQERIYFLRVIIAEKTARTNVGGSAYIHFSRERMRSSWSGTCLSAEVRSDTLCSTLVTLSYTSLVVTRKPSPSVTAT